MLDRVELDRTGSVSIRLALILEEDGVELHSSYHRAAIDFSGDVMAQMAPVITHLADQGYPPITPAALQLLQDGKTLITNYLTAIGHVPEPPQPLIEQEKAPR